MSSFHLVVQSVPEQNPQERSILHICRRALDPPHSSIRRSAHSTRHVRVHHRDSHALFCTELPPQWATAGLREQVRNIRGNQRQVHSQTIYKASRFQGPTGTNHTWAIGTYETCISLHFCETWAKVEQRDSFSTVQCE
jgi:hypothetical protein